MDKHAVIWTRAGGSPIKLANMTLTDSELRITKTEEAIEANIPFVSVLHDIAGERTLVHRRTENNALPPQLQALLPPANPGNPQRKILATLLERKINVRGLPIIEKDWHMLLFAGRNGIGHLDVFASDLEADAYYFRRQESASVSQNTSLWLAFNRFIRDVASEVDEQTVLNAIGPTPGISGFVPKLLTTIEIGNGWMGNDSSFNEIQALVKLEQAAYRGLLQLESLCFDYHRLAGFNVPRTWCRKIEQHGESLDLLAIERFDRDGAIPVPVESFYSILKTGSTKKYHQSTDGSMEDAAKLFDVLKMSATDKRDWYRRFVMAILTGNGDLHLENMSVLTGEYCKLSPVYDPAPMRAYRGLRNNHDILSALPFSNIGGMGELNHLPFSASGDTPIDLRERLLKFARAIGINTRSAQSDMDELLIVTQNYAEHAADILNSIPANVFKYRSPDINGFTKTLKEIRASVTRPRAHSLS